MGTPRSRRSDDPLWWIVCALVIASLVAAAKCLGAEAPKTAPPNSLVRVTLDDGERANVLRADFAPVDVAQTATGIVFTGPAGYRYCVVVSSDTGISFLFVEITGGPDEPTPGPLPPGPGPPPIPNEYGVGKIAYESAMAVDDGVGLGVLAEIYRSGASRYAGLQTANHVTDFNNVVKWMHEQTDTRIASASRWATWRKAIADAVRASYDSGNKSREAMGGILNELATALEAARDAR